MQLLAWTALLHSTSSLGRRCPSPCLLAKRASQGSEPSSGYRTLAGSFISPPEESLTFNEPPKKTTHAEREADDNRKRERDDVDTTDQLPKPWSERAVKQRTYWDDPERKAAALAKRSATIAAKRVQKGQVPKSRPTKQVSESTKKRAEAIKLRYADQKEWMRQRLDAGAEVRAQRNNDGYKAEQRRLRAEAAARRYAARRAKAETGGIDL